MFRLDSRCGCDCSGLRSKLGDLGATCHTHHLPHTFPHSPLPTLQSCFYRWQPPLDTCGRRSLVAGASPTLPTTTLDTPPHFPTPACPQCAQPLGHAPACGRIPLPLSATLSHTSPHTCSVSSVSSCFSRCRSPLITHLPHLPTLHSNPHSPHFATPPSQLLLPLANPLGHAPRGMREHPDPSCRVLPPTLSHTSPTISTLLHTPAACPQLLLTLPQPLSHAQHEGEEVVEGALPQTLSHTFPHFPTHLQRVKLLLPLAQPPLVAHHTTCGMREDPWWRVPSTLSHTSPHCSVSNCFSRCRSPSVTHGMRERNSWRVPSSTAAFPVTVRLTRERRTCVRACV
jgi:hypothetical protein